jgi:hypothetical protein
VAENKIGNGDAVVSVNVACQRSQGAVGHADGDRWHVLEVIRHGEQKDVHTDSNVLEGKRHRVPVEWGESYAYPGDCATSAIGTSL